MLLTDLLTSSVSVERLFLHQGEILLEVFFEFRQIVFSLVGLSLDLDGNILLDSDGHVLQVHPILLANYGFLKVVLSVDSLVLITLETLLDHVELKEILLLLGLDDHKRLLDASKLLDVVRDVLILDIDVALGLLDETLDVLDLVGHVLNHAGTVQLVVLGRHAELMACCEGRSSNLDLLSVGILVVDVDREVVHLSLHFVLHSVTSVVVIHQSVRELLGDGVDFSLDDHFAVLVLFRLFLLLWLFGLFSG